MNPLSKSTLLFATAAMLFAAPTVHASSTPTLFFDVDLNTSVLATAGDGPFSLEFQLNPGSGTLGGNTATISNFSFIGGNAAGSSSISTLGSGGTESGGLGSQVTLNDAGGFILFSQGFDSSVSNIKFSVALTENSSGQTPDGFDVAIDNGSGGEIVTNDPNFGVSLVSVDIGTDVPGLHEPSTIHFYESVGSATFVTGSGPNDTTTYSDNDAGVTTGVPEPSTWALGIAGLGLVVLFRRSRHAGNEQN